MARGASGAGSRPPLNYPKRPFHHFMQDASDNYPERVALRARDRIVTYRELDGLVNAFTNSLLRGGVNPGDRIAVIAGDSLEWIISMLAISQSGELRY